MDSFKYFYRKILVSLLRFYVGLSGASAASPDEVLYIASRDSDRKIKVHLYKRATQSTGKQAAGPVLLNLHGSGFILHAHGTDDLFCKRISRSTPYTILDIDYRHAPEHPFPAALNDIEDVLLYVYGKPDIYSREHVSISGFSAGGNLALASAAANLPRGTLTSVLAFYPDTDLCTDPGQRKLPSRTGESSASSHNMQRFFYSCYIPRGADKRDPRISPTFADTARFPEKMLVITAARDNLALEAERLAERVKKERKDSASVIYKRMEGCYHAWDKGPDGKGPREEIQARAMEEAYTLAEEVLKM